MIDGRELGVRFGQGAVEEFWCAELADSKDFRSLAHAVNDFCGDLVERFAVEVHVLSDSEELDVRARFSRPADVLLFTPRVGECDDRDEVF